jgi:hypothetical protein
MGTGDPDRDAADWQRASAEASAAMRAATEWRLRESGWRQVNDVVDGIYAAFGADDMKSAMKAIAQLEQLSPLRVITELGDPLRQPVPDDVRERINELIYELIPEADRAPGDSGDGEQDPDQEHGTPAG